MNQLKVYRDVRKETKHYEGITGSGSGYSNLISTKKDDDILAYIPGDWEAHLDELYRRIPEHRNERIRRESEEKAKIEQQKVEAEAKVELERKRQYVEDRKRCFGL